MVEGEADGDDNDHGDEDIEEEEWKSEESRLEKVCINGFSKGR